MSRSIGIDLGSKRVGLALSDKLSMIASPYKTLNYKNEQDLLDQLRIIIEDFKVGTIVLGLPLNMRGEDSAQTKKVRQFKSALSIFNLSIKLEDERLSSVSAKKSLVMQNIKTGHNKSEIDRRAAAIILQQFLDKK
ncbi:MAG: Holliday junction resolvase RuvX [Candidatus Neomarinimicrobiota bacterium]